MGESFIRDFFGMKRQHTERFRWTMSREFMAVTDSQHPNYPRDLFKQWTEKGWEVMSVTPQFNPLHSTEAWAVAVLRQAIPDGENTA